MSLNANQTITAICLLLLAAAVILLVLPALAMNGDYGVNAGRQPGGEMTAPPTPTPIFSATPTNTPVPTATNTPYPPPQGRRSG